MLEEVRVAVGADTTTGAVGGFMRVDVVEDGAAAKGFGRSLAIEVGCGG